MKKSILYIIIVAFTLNLNAQKIAEKFDEEVSIKLEEGTLMGSFLVPKSKKKIPIVLIVPGSGPTNRNCNSGLGITSNSFMYLAENLYKKKIATLRVDKRISGKSAPTFGANLVSVSFNDFISDTEKWIELLQKDDRFSDIIIAGHSQGSLVGMVAAKKQKATKFISLSGPGRPIDEVMHDQFNVSLPHLSDSTRMFLDLIKAGSYMNQAPTMLKQMFPIMIKDFMSEWMSYSPTEAIAGLDVPVLIINGKHDVQVGVKEAELLKEAQPNGVLVLIPGMSHILKNAPEERMENIATYNQPNLPINKQLVKEMVSFILN